ncbi:MAG: ATP-dependent DNA helicase [Burkholderiaceae bacterium]
MIRSEWQYARLEVFNALKASTLALQTVASAATPLKALAEYASRMQGSWLELLSDRSAQEKNPLAWHRWVELGAPGEWRVVRSSTNAALAFGSAMGTAAGARSWVFTSATLGMDDRLAWFTDQLGMAASEGLRTMRITSPFNHAQQACLYVPSELPVPGDERHSALLAAQVARWAGVLGGRTLVLTTSLRACEEIARTLRREFAMIRCPIQVVVQGEGSKGQLLDRFRSAAGGPPGAVMVASASFWEGVDLPGNALQLLVIDKLPFPSPDDPMAQARASRASAQGADAFEAGYLNSASMALRQGAGRLIRRANDQGILVIADRRLLTHSYGQRLLRALPPMKQLFEAVEMDEAVARLASGR